MGADLARHRLHRWPIRLVEAANIVTNTALPENTRGGQRESRTADDVTHELLKDLRYLLEEINTKISLLGDVPLKINGDTNA